MSRTYYDGQTGVTATTTPTPAIPVRGQATAVWTQTGAGVVDTPGVFVSATVTRTSYESTGHLSGWGRPVGHVDARGKRTDVIYASFSGAVLTSAGNHNTQTVTTEQPLVTTGVARLASTVTYDGYGREISSEDPNGLTSRACYDALGRVTKVFNPATGGTCTSPGFQEFAYLAVSITPVGSDVPPSWTIPTWRLRTSTLFAYQSEFDNPPPNTTTDPYVLQSHALVDGNGRVVETHTPSPAGGRVVTRTRYNSLGQTVRTSAPYHDTATAGLTLDDAADAAIPTDTQTVYDHAGRVVNTIVRDNNVAIRESETVHTGNTTRTYPMHTYGGTTAFGSTIARSDVYGNTVQTTEYVTTTSSIATYYTFDLADQLTTITDNNGNPTEMTYNLLGQQIGLSDPNAGMSLTHYYETGQVAAVYDGVTPG